MIGIGLGELFVIAIVALVVLDPKDLPHIFYTLGRWYQNIYKWTQTHSLENIFSEFQPSSVKNKSKTPNKEHQTRLQRTSIKNE